MVVVTDPQPFLAICNEFFGASKVAVMDDGLAGFIGCSWRRQWCCSFHWWTVVVKSVGRNDTQTLLLTVMDWRSTFGDEGRRFLAIEN